MMPNDDPPGPLTPASAPNGRSPEMGRRMRIEWPVQSASSRFRLLLDGPAPGAWNMAVDEALLAGVGAGDSPPTLRFYRWQPACLSLGYFQASEVADAAACDRYQVDVVRRATGGRAIYHDRELTYSVVMPLSWLKESQSVISSYGRLSQVLVNGLHGAGYPVEAVPDPIDHRQDRGPACFDRPARHEILLEGRKVVGSAQVRRGGALLQHGSILFAPQVEETIRLLRLTDQDRNLLRLTMTAGVGGLDRLGPVEPDRIVASIVEAFSQAFQAEPVQGQLGPHERWQADGLRQPPGPRVARVPGQTTRTR